MSKKHSSQPKETLLDTKKESGPVKEPNWFQKLRGSHKFRLIFIGILLVIVGVMFVYWTKMRIWLAIAFIALLAAFGLEATKTDFDMGTLMKTGSFKESKVQRDTNGDIFYDKNGDMVTEQSKGKKSNEWNCSDFESQPKAQAFFVKVGGAGNDVNRLDGDKDGEACEGLPKN